MYSGPRYGWLNGRKDGDFGEGQQYAIVNFDLREPGKQKEKGSRGCEVGTFWNVQRVSENRHSPIHWALEEMNRDFCVA